MKDDSQINSQIVAGLPMDNRPLFPLNSSIDSNSMMGVDFSLPQLPAIVANTITMTFPDGKQQIPVLHEVNVNVPKGAVQLLMGPSGSGKTTLLSILAGLLTPTQGTVHLLGQEITKMSATALAKFRLQHIGFIFQGFNLFPALTAVENVEVVLNLKGIKGKVARQEAENLLEKVNLADKFHSLPRDLSGGQKQRVAIARALAGNPQLIMADEPTAALDSCNGHAVIELLKRLAKQDGATVLMVTHDPRIVDVADQIVYLEDGAIKINT